ncbi:MAG: UDP-glucose/GDP-mannose dehydrogenase family protein [Acidimicrobiia bacterium]|nr:UDP-glucose/GDP-mannose dehydrogenase family protein [Acidimicrobiia bacterium]
MGLQSSIAVVGSGYVGTVVAACMATLGHEVVGVEIDSEKLELLRNGDAPFYEPGLDERLRSAVDSGRLTFTDDFELALERSEVVFLCVDTPPGENGHPNTTSVAAAARAIGRAMYKPHVLVTKSTVPVGSGNWLATTVENELPDGVDPSVISVVSNPEFLREGSAIDDFLYPDRIVLGSDDVTALQLVQDAYQPILDQSFPGADPTHRPVLVRTDRSTAETIKYAANAFLATKISFINEIAEICEWVGADIDEVAYALGLDKRISPEFLHAGVGWGGSCFAKDLEALAATARSHGQEPRILEAATQVNKHQRHRLVRKLQENLRPLRGSRIALLGLAFKPNTDDTRDAPAIEIAASLMEKGAIVRAYDPMVKSIPELPNLQIVRDPYLALERADALVLVTEWAELTKLDFHEVATRMRGNIVVDGRNAFDPRAVKAAGLTYEGVGKGVMISNGRYSRS